MNTSGQGFAAHLFRPDFGNEVIAGQITIDRNALWFTSAVVTERILLEDVVVELGEDGGRIDFHDPNRPDLTLYTVDDSIMESRAFQQTPALYGQVSAILSQRELRRRLRLVFYFFGACAVVIWLVSWLSGVMVQSLAEKVPPDWEQSFGSKQIEAMRKQHLLLDDSNHVAQLTALAEPLIRAVPLGETRVTFYIAGDPDPNAFALPGGYVVVNAGLLQMADRPEELLGVIAHELAHVARKHHIRTMISAAGPILIFGVFLHSGDGAVDILSQGSGIMIYEGFSQEYESEADEMGWKYLVAAKVDPRGMISMFRKLQAHEAAEKIKDILPQAFQSHPALDKRIARLERQARKLPVDAGFLELTNPVPQVSDQEMEKLLRKKHFP